MLDSACDASATDFLSEQISTEKNIHAYGAHVVMQRKDVKDYAKK